MAKGLYIYPERRTPVLLWLPDANATFRAASIDMPFGKVTDDATGFAC